MKKFAYVILCNKLTGMLIMLFFGNKIPNLRYPSFRFAINADVDKRIAASVFWGFYESAEIRFVEKFFQGSMDVIEMGASSGVLSSHIVSKFKDHVRRLISIEANSELSNVWHENVSRANRVGASAVLLNLAIYYDGESVNFGVSTNSTESSISNGGSKNTNEVNVRAITLSSLVQQYKLGEYVLFCDIEGGELQIFANETSESLSECKYLFIELHDSSYKNKDYTVEQLDVLIHSKGFQLIARHGPVFYYSNINS